MKSSPGYNVYRHAAKRVHDSKNRFATNALWWTREHDYPYNAYSSYFKLFSPRLGINNSQWEKQWAKGKHPDARIPYQVLSLLFAAAMADEPWFKKL